MSRLFDLLIRYPRASMLTVIAITIGIGLGAMRLRVDFSPEQVYVGQNDAVEFSETHKKLFRFEDSLVLVLLQAIPEPGEHATAPDAPTPNLLRQDCLTWMKTFSERVSDVEGVRNVTSVVTLERPRVSSGASEGVTWSPLFPEDLYSDTALLEQRLEQMPLLNDLLISEDHLLMMTLIDLDPADRTIARATRRITSVENILAETPLPSGTRTFVSGVPAIRVDVIRSIMHDQMKMVPICSALFLVVSLMIFRSVIITGLSLLAVLTAVALTLGLMGWSGSTFSIMSNVIPTLVLIIGAANNVHILSRFQVEVRNTGKDIPTCVKVTMMEMSGTCFLTLATTGIGFASLLVAQAELLQSLAIQAALGMACCYISLMLVVTCTMVMYGRLLCPWLNSAKPVTDQDSSTPAPLHSGEPHSEPVPSGLKEATSARSAWHGFAHWICRHDKAIVAFHLLLGAWTLWMCRSIPINSYMFETYDGDHPTMEAVRIMDERMSGLISLEIQLKAPDRDRFFDEDVAAALAKVREQIPEDRRVSFYRDYVEVLSAFDHGRALSRNSATAAASLRRVRLVLKQLDRPEFTAAFLCNDQPLARVMMRIQDIGSARMKEMFAGITTILQKELPPDIQFTLTGDAYLHAICMDVFVRDLFYSLITASVIIFSLITVLFRSLRIGLISAVPNMLPLVMTLGYMHLRGYELTAGNVIVFAISLGIAVDDTIHFLARYRDERINVGREEAIVGTLMSSGKAIVLTSVLVVSGLSVLIYSDFVPTRRFAELTAVTMCSALPGDVILLPALLSLFGSQRKRTDHLCL